MTDEWREDWDLVPTHGNDSPDPSAEDGDEWREDLDLVSPETLEMRDSPSRS